MSRYTALDATTFISITLILVSVSSFYVSACSCFFFFNDTATTEIYTLSLHDALPICGCLRSRDRGRDLGGGCLQSRDRGREDRKSTRLNSSHSQISYAVFCLKKKNKHEQGAAESCLPSARSPHETQHLASAAVQR